ncbi:MAG TPA: YhbY family RNA-binding protein [Erysipelothrix sp.]|nr:YhbY family RNA-binding protein [Erysipelothrix sp.]
MLSNTQKKELRSIAHQEKVMVQIGKNGITDTVLESFENALLAHNLVKVNLLKSAPITVDEVKKELVERFSVDVVSQVGRVLVVYRYNKEGRVII